MLESAQMVCSFRIGESFKMLKKINKLIFGGILLFAINGIAQSAVLTFEDVPGSQPNKMGRIGNYNGFDFSQNLYWVDTVTSSWKYGSVSGIFTVINNGSGAGTITKETSNDFIFDGLFARVWANNPDRTGYIVGLNDGSEVWRSEVNLTTSWAFFGGQVDVIDELQLDLGNYFLVDNVALSEVPVPPAVWLFASALLGLLGFSRRRNK